MAQDLALGTFYCHICECTVDPVMEAEIKCPSCEQGFVEEMDDGFLERIEPPTLGSRLSLLSPMMLRMLARQDAEGLDEDLALPSRRRFLAIIQLLQSLQELDLNDSPSDQDRESMILASVLQDYIGSDQIGIDQLLQRLGVIDDNQYGSPPARKEAVDALPMVKIAENGNCSVCLEEFKIGMDARELPCRHKFHCDCILPWLELHCSCPVCRFQLPAEESNISDRSGNGSREESSGGTGANAGG